MSIGGFQLTEAPGLTGVVLALIIVLILTLRPQGMLRPLGDRRASGAPLQRSATEGRGADETWPRYRSMAMPVHGREQGERHNEN